MSFVSFRTDGSREKINFVLQFKGQQDETLQEYIFGILIEIAPRTTVNGQISIVVGPLAVYEQSLAIEQATVAVVTTALPIGNMGAGVTSVRPDSKSQHALLSLKANIYIPAWFWVNTRYYWVIKPFKKNRLMVE